MKAGIKNKILLLIIGCCSFSAVTMAQDTLTAEQAVNIALKNSLDIQLQKNTIEAAGIRNDPAFAGGLPTVNGNISDQESLTSVNQKLNTGITIQRNNAKANALGANVTGNILLYNGGRVVATKKRLAELERLSNDQLNGQIQNTIANVLTAYYDVVRQQDYIKTINRSIDASNQQLSIVKARQNLGLANNADLFQAQIDLNALQQSKQQQELIVAQSKAELMRLLTQKADSSFNVKDTIVVDRNIVLQTILDNIPKSSEITAADDQVRINELIVKETNALRYPSVSAFAGYNFSRNQSAAGQTLLNQNYGPVVGVTLGIPLFNGGLYRKQTQIARIDVRNAETQKQIILRDNNASAIKQFESYSSNLRQLETEKENYRLSGQLLDLVLKRFELRQATIVEVKNAQQSFEASGFRLVNLSYAAKASEIELKRIANILP